MTFDSKILEFRPFEFIFIRKILLLVKMILNPKNKNRNLSRVDIEQNDKKNLRNFNRSMFEKINSKFLLKIP